MTEDKDAMPSDAETSGLKPQDPQDPQDPKDPKDREPSAPPPDDKRTKEDPSEQPS